MKTNKYHIVCARILLICFIAGQYMVYAHRHSIAPRPSAIVHVPVKNVPQQTVSEKCYLCDVMHHNSMVITAGIHFSESDASMHVFKAAVYNFKSIQLILSSGRAPPSSTFRS